MHLDPPRRDDDGGPHPGVGRRVGAALAGLLAAATLVVATPAARAADGCGGDVVDWAEACAAREGVPVRPVRCLSDALILGVGPAPDELVVEIRAAGPRPFRPVGALDVAPVGEFSDWRAAPAPLRSALDHAVACVSAEEPPLIGAAPSEFPQVWTFGDGPWGLLHLAAALAVWLAVLRRARRPGLRTDLVVAAALGVFAVIAHHVLVPAAFFHQNGHGPLWAHYAWCGGSPYGYGYRLLFGFPAALGGPAAEQGIFVLQELLGALAVACLYGAVRLVTASRWLAVAFALALATQPLVARMDRSESYYGAILSLVVVAAAILATLVRLERPWRRPAGWAVALAAGAVAGIAAAMHPVGWLPVALVPLVLALGPGSRRVRALRVLVAGALFTVAVAAVAGPVVLEVLGGPVGAKWLPQAGATTRPTPLLILLAAAPLALVAVPGRLGRLAIAAAIVVAAAVVADATNLVGRQNPVIQATSWTLLYVPVAGLALAAALAQLAALAARPLGSRASAWARPALAAGALLAASAFAVSDGARETRLPTDALEIQRFVTARDTIPRGVSVIALFTSGARWVELPLYGDCQPGLSQTVSLDFYLENPGHFHPRAPLFYYRSSLCSVASGAARCEAFESHVTLEPIYEAHLPAIPSHLDPADDYQADPVRVGLYRVLRR